MSKLQGLEALFEGRHFDREVIILCVRWYLRFKLSLRDLVEMMAERGPVDGPHDDHARWVQRYAPEKLRIAPMLGFKRFDTAAITIAGIELLRRIHKGQFNLGKLRLKDRNAPAVWNAVLATR